MEKVGSLMVKYVFNPSIQKKKGGRSLWGRGQSSLQCECQDSQGKLWDPVP